MQVALDASALVLHGVDGALAGLGQGVDPGRQRRLPGGGVGADGQVRQCDVDAAERPPDERHEQQQHGTAERHGPQHPARHGLAQHGAPGGQGRRGQGDHGPGEQGGHEQTAGQSPHGHQRQVQQGAPGPWVQTDPAPRGQVRGTGLHRWDPGAQEDRDAPPLGTDHPERHEQGEGEHGQRDQRHRAERGPDGAEHDAEEHDGQEQVEDEVDQGRPAS